MRASGPEFISTRSSSRELINLRIGDPIVKTIPFVLLIVLCAGCTTYSKKKHAVNAFGGVRSLENSDFDDIDDATVWGAEGLLGLTHSGLGLEGGYAHSEQDGGPLFSGTGGTDSISPSRPLPHE